MRKRDPHPKKMKAMRLTSHTAAMHLMVQFPGNGVVPRERFGPIPQLFVGAPSEQGVETLMAHREVMQDLQHLNQDRDRNGEQNQ